MKTNFVSSILLSILIQFLCSEGFSYTIEFAPYSGEYQDTSDYKELKENLKNIVKKSLQTIDDRLGLQAKDTDVITFSFTDRMLALGQAQVHLDRKTFGIKSNISINFNKYFTGRMNINKVVTHELIHILLRKRMMESFLKDQKNKTSKLLDEWRLPNWIDEGLVVWGSGGLEITAKNTIIQFVVYSLDPLLLIDGLAREPHEVKDYIEDALFVEYIYKTKGLKGIKEYVAFLVKSGTYDKSLFSKYISNLYHLPFEKVLEHVEVFSKNYIQDLLTKADYKDFSHVLLSINKNNFEDTILKLQTFIETHKNSFFVPVGKLFIGFCYGWQKNYSEALSIFKNLSHTYKVTSCPYVVGNAILHMGKCYAGMKQYSEASEIFKVFLLGYAEDSQIGDGLYYYAFSHFKLKEYTIACELFEEAIKRDTAFMESSYYRLIDCYMKENNEEKAHEVFKTFEKKYPDSEEVDKSRELLNKIDVV